MQAACAPLPGCAGMRRLSPPCRLCGAGLDGCSAELGVLKRSRATTSSTRMAPSVLLLELAEAVKLVRGAAGWGLGGGRVCRPQAQPRAPPLPLRVHRPPVPAVLPPPPPASACVGVLCAQEDAYLLINESTVVLPPEDELQVAVDESMAAGPFNSTAW